jgi:hypothetical protein
VQLKLNERVFSNFNCTKQTWRMHFVSRVAIQADEATTAAAEAVAAAAQLSRAQNKRS